MRKVFVAVLIIGLGVAGLHILLTPPQERPPEFDDPRPIAMGDSVWLEELTWMEVRDGIADGKITTVIVPSGGIEEAGPYLAIGKHNFIVSAGCEAIARKLGNALCAPVVRFVPRGNIEPPTGMMRYPGTISVTDETYKALVTDIVRSLMQHGFKNILLISDSGEKQPALQAIAASFSNKWRRQASSVHFIPEYKNNQALRGWVAETFGWKEKREGIHDDPRASTMMMAVDPNLVRIRQREAKGKASINGISLLPVEKSVEAGRKIMEYRADNTVAAIKKRLAASDSTTR